MKNITRYIDLPAIMNEVAFKTLLSTNELRSAVGSAKKQPLLARLARRLVRSKDIFAIAIKPFMDVSITTRTEWRTAVTICSTEGRVVSFCEYNALVRERDSWAKFPAVKPA